MELTATELDVLHWMVRGHSNAEIGYELHRSTSTVKSHVTNIMVKLDARTRTGASWTALERGIVVCPHG